jgi:putative transposase
MTKRSPFKYFKTSPEIIRLSVMLYVRFPLSKIYSTNGV